MNKTLSILVACCLLVGLMAPAVAFAAKPGGGGRSAIVQGTVRSSGTGTGIAGAAVQFEKYVAKTKSYTAAGVAHTNASGVYTASMGSGTYRTTYTATGYASQTKTQSFSAGVTYTIDVALVPTTGTVEGYVRSSFPLAPLAGAAVEFKILVGPNTYSSLATVYTDVNGHYSYAAAPGDYEIIFSSVGWLPDTQYATVATGSSYTMDAGLSPAPATVAGAVTNASSGTPISSAVVEFERYDDVSGSYLSEATILADSNGHYSYSGVAGTYRITFSRDAGWPGGYVSHVVDAVTLAGLSYTVDAALKPIPATGVWGMVWAQYPADPGPISGAAVEFRSQTGPIFPTTQNLYSVDFVDTLTGWAVGYSGTILKSTDGGVTWTQQTSGTTNYLDSVHFANPSTGWAVGYSGTIRKTTDGGATWLPQTSGTSRSLSSVQFIDPSTGWAVGASGTILRTLDGGVTWTQQASGTPYSLESVTFINASTGWAVGGYGTILKTTNGGTTWIGQTSGTTQTIYSVDFADASTGWAVGDWATLLKTSDGGATWIPQASGATQALYSVDFADASTGWAVGPPGTVLRTTDGGATWIPQASNTSATLLSVSLVDSSTGWAVGPSGSIVMTQDGGTTWSTPGAYSTVATVYTDSDGFYEYDALPGSYQLVFSKDGHLRDTQYVTVAGGSAYRHDAYLPPAP